jgi:hypothetical protein
MSTQQLRIYRPYWLDYSNILYAFTPRLSLLRKQSPTLRRTVSGRTVPRVFRRYL